MASKGKRARSPEHEESLEQLFAATALGEDPLCRALKRLHTAHDEPSGFSNVQASGGAGDEAESSATTSQAVSVQPSRPPAAAMECGPTMSSDSRTTGPPAGPSSGLGQKDRPQPRASMPLDDDLDSSSASESEASVTRWRPPGPSGPSAGTSAADSTHSSGWVQSQADADSATSQRYLLPRFVISTRTRPSHPQLEPLPLRPHTAQFHPSQAAAAGPSLAQQAGAENSAAVEQAWGARPALRPRMAPQAGADRGGAQPEVRVAAGGRRVREREEGPERPRAGDRRRAPPLDHPPRVAPALRMRPAGLQMNEEDQAEVEDDFDPEGEGGDERPEGAEPVVDMHLGVGPRLANVGYNAIMDELPGRLERIQVAGERAAREGGERANAGVEEPTTPTREEYATSAEGGARAVGARAVKEGDAAYDSLYEETNHLLKNLHFERVKRWTRSANPSPFPSRGPVTVPSQSAQAS